MAAREPNWLEHHPALEILKEEDPDCSSDEEEEQVFDEHLAFGRRLCRSLYYGREVLVEDHLSKPVTEWCVSYFNEVGLSPGETRLDHLSMAKAAKIGKESHASPTSLVLALLYLERLRSANPGYLSSVSSADLFLVSMIVASKFLYDDGEECEVLNVEWAAAGGVELKELKRMEIEFLAALDFRVYVSPEDFESMTCVLETNVVEREVLRRGGWTTYSDLLILLRGFRTQVAFEWLMECTLKMTAVCLATYATSLFTMVATFNILSRANLGPTAMSGCLSTVLNAALPEDVTTPTTSPPITSGLEGYPRERVAAGSPLSPHFPWTAGNAALVEEDWTFDSHTEKLSAHRLIEAWMGRTGNNSDHYFSTLFAQYLGLFCRAIDRGRQAAARRTITPDLECFCKRDTAVHNRRGPDEKISFNCCGPGGANGNGAIFDPRGAILNPVTGKIGVL